MGGLLVQFCVTLVDCCNDQACFHVQRARKRSCFYKPRYYISLVWTYVLFEYSQIHKLGPSGRGHREGGEERETERQRDREREELGGREGQREVF